MAAAARLSGIKPTRYDCCVDSCCCFVGPHANLDNCPYCNKSCQDEYSQPRKQFSYLPLIPRLKILMRNKELQEKMQYCSQHAHNPDVVDDVFDGHVYRSLLDKHVEVNGKTKPYKFFSDDQDIPLGLSTDGYGLFKHQAKTAWPLLLFNYNLPPDLRFLQEYTICVGVIPGPKKPHDWDSFAWPLIQELLHLAEGVTTWDTDTRDAFILRAYLILVFGDIPAMSMVMRMKGHNGVHPCRWCNIKGVQIPGHSKSPYYCPLHHSWIPNGGGDYNAYTLPLWTHEEFMQHAHAAQYAPNATESEKCAKESGIKGIPLLSYLSSLSFPHSFPYDFMHLIWENLMKNLFLLWTGDFKDLDMGTGDYKISSEAWKEIGKESGASSSTIPSSFGPPPPDVAAERVHWTADLRSFWTCYVGPVLLKEHLKAKYFQHYVRLVKLLHKCLLFEISRDEIAVLREGFVQWVIDYEK